MPCEKLGLGVELPESNLAVFGVSSVGREVDFVAKWPVVDDLSIPGHKMHHRLPFVIGQLDPHSQLALVLLN